MAKTASYENSTERNASVPDFSQYKPGDLLRIRARPGSSVNQLCIRNGAMHAFLSARPEQNKANTTLVKLLKKNIA